MKIFLILAFSFSLLFSKSEILEIDAINFSADDKKGISTFTGSVKVKMGEDRLNANKVDIFFETDKKTNNKVPLKYEATGDADFKIISKDKHYEGKGDKIIYNPKKEEYTIIGNGFVHEKNDDRKIYGEHIYINQLSGEANVKGDSNKPVKFIINVDRGDKN